MGKSTILRYVSETLTEFYKFINDEWLNETNPKSPEERKVLQKRFEYFNTCIRIFDENNNNQENTNFSMTKLYIPVIYKMHDTIKPEKAPIFDFERIVGKFFETIKQKDNELIVINNLRNFFAYFYGHLQIDLLSKK